MLADALARLDGTQLRDFRDLRNIGADSVDELKRFFELKTAQGAMPDDVRFEPGQFERAARAGSGYFLAVVAGLEEGQQTVIRIVADPVRTLSWRRKTLMTLSGIRSARALEIHIETPDERA